LRSFTSASPEEDVEQAKNIRDKPERNNNFFIKVNFKED
jgi:hypothetical protein